jgi:hypothetical protein
MMGGPLEEDAPPFPGGQVDVVDLESHLVLSVRDPVRRSSSVWLSCAVRNTIFPLGRYAALAGATTATASR